MQNSDPILQIFEPVLPILNTFTAKNDLALQYSYYQHDYRLLILWQNQHGHIGSITIEPSFQRGWFVLYVQCVLSYRVVSREAMDFPSDIGRETLLTLLEESRGWIESCQQPAAEEGLSAEEVYLQQIQVEANPQVRVNAASRLGEIGTPQAIEGIVAAAQNEDINVRMVALRTIGILRRRGKLSTDRVAGVLQFALQDASELVRVVAQEVREELEVDARCAHEDARRATP